MQAMTIAKDLYFLKLIRWRVSQTLRQMRWKGKNGTICERDNDQS